MNSLTKEQIHFEEMRYKQELDSFNLGFISKRLKKLIDLKKEKEEWEVMQLRIQPGELGCYGYEAVFVAPSKKSLLMVKEK
jgi:hypothetical protein